MHLRDAKNKTKSRKVKGYVRWVTKSTSPLDVMLDKFESLREVEVEGEGEEAREGCDLEVRKIKISEFCSYTK